MKVEEEIKTHNVGGLLGMHYRDELGIDTCRKVNRILMVYCQWCEVRQNVEVRSLTMFAESQPKGTDSAEYNIPRYPGTNAPTEDDIVSDIEFIDNFVSNIVGEIISQE